VCSRVAACVLLCLCVKSVCVGGVAKPNLKDICFFRTGADRDLGLGFFILS